MLFDFLTDREDRPNSYTVEVTYQGEAGQNFTETILLDLGIYRGFLEIDRQDIHNVSLHLKQVVTIMKRWSAGHDGLLVITPEEARERRERRLRESREAYEEMVSELPVDETPDAPSSDTPN